jgi:hypothetical protein
MHTDHIPYCMVCKNRHAKGANMHTDHIPYCMVCKNRYIQSLVHKGMYGPPFLHLWCNALTGFIVFDLL